LHLANMMLRAHWALETVIDRSFGDVFSGWEHMPAIDRHDQTSRLKNFLCFEYT